MLRNMARVSGMSSKDVLNFLSPNRKWIKDGTDGNKLFYICVFGSFSQISNEESGKLTDLVVVF